MCYNGVVSQSKGERMARRRSKAPNPTEGFDRFIKLKNGRTLTEGDEFTVIPEVRYRGHWGTGRYRFMYVSPSGDVTGWGPINRGGNTPKGRVRSFKPNAIEVVHNKAKGRKSAA